MAKKLGFGSTDIQAFNDGDKRAFTAAYENYSEKIKTFSLSILKVEKDAQDVVADIFKDLFEKKRLFESWAHLNNYLHVVARNKCFNLLKKRRRAIPLTTNEEDSFSFYQNIEENVLKEARLDQLQTEVARLPPELKTILYYFVYEKKTGEEIMLLTGLTRRQVYGRLKRARELIRKNLETKGFGPFFLSLSLSLGLF